MAASRTRRRRHETRSSAGEHRLWPTLAVVEVASTSSERSNWRPEFVDYLYVSLTNSSAFSPTDTMPLTARAKMLMGLEATAALLTSLLVVARAIGALGQ